LIQLADRSEIEFKVAGDVTKPVKFGKIHGFCDVKGNFELNFRTIGSLHEVAADFSPPFFRALFDGFLDNN